MINVFGAGRPGSETPLPLAGAQTPLRLWLDNLAEGRGDWRSGAVLIKKLVLSLPATLLTLLPLC